MKLSRRQILKGGAVALAASTVPAGCVGVQKREYSNLDISQADDILKVAPSQALEGKPMPIRVIYDNIYHPYWYAEHDMQKEADYFWDKKGWEESLRKNAEDGYNVMVYFVQHWLVHTWQNFLLRHEEFPEARDFPEEEQERIIDQVKWIFATAKSFGLMNFLYNTAVVTTQAYARAHGLDKDFPISDKVNWRHNYQHKIPGGITYDRMIHWGVRNEKTRAFTEAAVAELFQIYDDLDGLFGPMGEALAGKRSSWFKEAYAPGLRRCGRKPIFVLNNWMMPLEDFLEDIASKEVYDNVWLAVEHNGETISGERPYPSVMRWAEQANMPVILIVVPPGYETPMDPPKLAHDIVQQHKKIKNCVGTFLHMPVSDYRPMSPMFTRAIGYYGKTGESYSDEPWIEMLEEKYGDRSAAQHFVNAYNISGRIPVMVNALAWCPHSGRVPHQLILKYWYWTKQDKRYGYFTSPDQGAELLPVWFYAAIVAERGEAYRDRNGSEYDKHPYSQNMMWGHVDYQITPEEWMRRIKKRGEECFAEAQKAIKHVKENRKEAQELRDWMKAYQLLTRYYEKKVLAATSAVIYRLTHKADERALAEKYADEALNLHTRAMNFIWVNIDRKKGEIKGGWWNERRDIPGLMKMETEEREQLPSLFNWPDAGDIEKERAKLGTTEQEEE